MRRFSIFGFLAALAVLAFGPPAQAKRTLIDNGSTSDLGGYCDLDGIDCFPTPLGFSVDFGPAGGGAVSDFMIYGNGLISFDPTYPVFDDPAYIAAFSGQAGYFGNNVISPGPFNTLIDDVNGSGNPVFFQSAVVNFIGQTIDVKWFICTNTVNCNPTYSAQIVPVASGLNVSFSYALGRPASAAPYISIADLGSNVPDLSKPFFIPATVTGLPSVAAVPEPGAWAMMILGLAAIGIALRRRRVSPTAFATA